LLFILAALFLGLLAIKPATAKAPQSNNGYEDVIDESGQYKLEDGAVKPLPAAFASGNSPDSLAKLLDTSASKRISQYVSQSSNVAQYSGRHYSKDEVIQLIKDYSAQYGISADLPLRVANCESGFNQASKNNHSTASGVYQYLASTWRNTEVGKAGISVFDADANVHMAIKSIASGGIGNWNASRRCWSNN